MVLGFGLEQGHVTLHGGDSHLTAAALVHGFEAAGANLFVDDRAAHAEPRHHVGDVVQDAVGNGCHQVSFKWSCDAYRIDGPLLPSSVFSDQLLLEEPVDGAALGAHVAEAMPVGDEIGKSSKICFLNRRKGSSPFERGGQTPLGSSVAEAVGKVDHVLIPDVGREGSMRMRSSSSTSMGF